MPRRDGLLSGRKRLLEGETAGVRRGSLKGDPEVTLPQGCGGVNVGAATIKPDQLERTLRESVALGLRRATRTRAMAST